MPLKRFLNLDSGLKKRVLDIAREEFAQHGYEAMSLNGFLQKAEISKGQFYYWFEDKADLFLTIVGEAAEGINLTIMSQNQPSSAGDFWQHMETYNQVIDEWWANNLEHLPIFARAMELPFTHNVVDRAIQLFEPKELHIRQTVELGQQWGLVRTDISLDSLMELFHHLHMGFGFFEMQNLGDCSHEKGAKISSLLVKLTKSLLECE